MFVEKKIWPLSLVQGFLIFVATIAAIVLYLYELGFLAPILQALRNR
jgi:hypothetical protein